MSRPMPLGQVEVSDTGNVTSKGGGPPIGMKKSKSKQELSVEARAEKLRRDVEFVEHTWPVDRLYAHFHTDLTKGLSFDQVKKNREQFGSNRLTPPKTTPWWLKYLLQYTNFFALLLLVAGCLCFVAYVLDKRKEKENLYLASILFGVVFVTCTFSYIQESKSERVMETLMNLIPTKCHVIRDGYDNVIDATEVVPGDVVLLADGDRVPADVRIITADDFRVDNSSLTGEAEPVERSPELQLNAAGEPITQTLEASNLAFYTTIVASGHARGVIIACGDNTVMGQIAGLALETSTLQTPIAREIDHFVTQIATGATCMGVLFGILSLAIGNHWLETVVFAIGVIVANVPEGLMATVTVSLSLAAHRMHSKNVLVKNLESVETLGSTTVICSDKTGTLTQNRMSVRHLWYDGKIFTSPAPKNRVEWEAMFKDAVLGQQLYNPEATTFSKLQLIATLCNNASFAAGSQSMNMDVEMAKPGFNIHALPCAGDASEQGLLKFVEPIRSAKNMRIAWPKLYEIKFNSLNKWQLSIHKHEGGYPPLLVLKGAAERVLAKCSKIMVNGQAQPITEALRRQYHDAYETLGGFGERVMGFAYSDLEGFANDFPFTNKPQPNFPSDNLTFVGLISLMDPPRSGVKEAVTKCKTGGIKVYMVTGDHPITATAIAKEVGILDQEKMDSGRAQVVTGDDIRRWQDESNKSLSQEYWDEALNRDQVIFARVSPAHKLLIVEHCQRRGEIVAVTGDGVNDAPALKKADIGIAMGISGKDVTKEAADMVLMDDNFASIVMGVEEGRLIFDNLKKTICYALTVNCPELIPFLVNVIIGIPLPLSTVLMLAICLGTDMLPAVSLAYEEKEADIMERPPRNAKVDRLVTGRLVFHAYLIIGIVQTFAGFLAYMVVLNDYGYEPHILPFIDRELDFSLEPILCTVSSNGSPIACGYGCNEPNYQAGLPNPVNARGKYCFDGCDIPWNCSNPETRVDPFSEFNCDGFKGPEYCDLTCESDPKMFDGGKLPTQCDGSALSEKIGFPKRKPLGPPHAPVGAWYWWAGKKQPMPNWVYQQQVLLFAQSSYFVAVMVTQWANVIVCKTRKLSVFTQGMGNWVLNFSLLFETGVAALLLYTPGLQTVFSTRPIMASYWIWGLPFFLGILILGELRKKVIRAMPGKWVDRWTYW
eukprot:TRINITY_DN7756_c0_g1_i2.p1 TRINITY_DN7756_c0_g1~~TRINITY_DN7756_c0_g1_i2.p1  ORF type:complete len:1167 (+),score=247.04 TRINITY_DN7756_c0_g1_i2:363-3863(+)